MAVNLTIIDNDEASIGRNHRLMSSRREIQNRQPPVHKRQAAFVIDPSAVIVGPAMLQAGVHGRTHFGQSMRNVA
jgi:hypothetical protein